MFVYYHLSNHAGIHDSVYALTQVKGLAEADTTQAPLSSKKFICHLSTSLQSLLVALD